MDFLGGSCALTSETTYVLCFGFDFVQTCYHGNTSLKDFDLLPGLGIIIRFQMNNKEVVTLLRLDL